MFSLSETRCRRFVGIIVTVTAIRVAAANQGGGDTATKELPDLLERYITKAERMAGLDYKGVIAESFYGSRWRWVGLAVVAAVGSGYCRTLLAAIPMEPNRPTPVTRRCDGEVCPECLLGDCLVGYSVFAIDAGLVSFQERRKYHGKVR